MRADRLLQIMVLLQNNGKMTTRELANSLEVSERTILRDMDALSFAGIPVVSERGKFGGWRLVDRFQSAISGLKVDELKSLFILPSDQLLDQLGIRPGGRDIRRKLAAAMPQAVKSSARQYLEKIHIDTGTWKRADHKPSETLGQVLAALWEDRWLQIRYQKANGEYTERMVQPLGLVIKGSTWYLAAGGDNGECRTYRIARISQAEAQPDTFIRPERFDLSAYWHESKAQFAASLPRFEVEVRMDPSIMNRLTFTDKFVQKVEIGTAPDGEWIPATLHVHSEEEAVSYVLGFGGKMRIIRPEHLIPQVVEQAKAALSLYGAEV